MHRRLWPALVCIANRFAPAQLAQVREEHASSGRHVTHEIRFPEWVPEDVVKSAKAFNENDALSVFSRWVPS